MSPSCPVDRRPFTNVYRWDGNLSCVQVRLPFLRHSYNTSVVQKRPVAAVVFLIQPFKTFFFKKAVMLGLYRCSLLSEHSKFAEPVKVIELTSRGSQPQLLEQALHPCICNFYVGSFLMDGCLWPGTQSQFIYAVVWFGEVVLENIIFIEPVSRFSC